MRRRDVISLPTLHNGALGSPAGGYSTAMGTNAVRLIRSEHRRISDLLSRLNGRHRGGAELPVRVAHELSAHVTACRDCLLPFADARLSVDGAVAESLDELAAAAQRLRDEAGEPMDAAELVATMRRHVDTEESHVLQPLEEAASVDRLRRLGESFRRTRDSALRAAGDPRRRHARPTPSRAELYEHARFREIAGRSAMSRAELLEALREPSHLPDTRTTRKVL